MYVNTIETDICIIGGGVSGLTMASVAAQLGLGVVLFEGHKMGGDCLNVGCVPSKSLLAAGHAAENARNTSKKFGVNVDHVSVDMQAVHDHIHGVIKSIEPHDSPVRFERLGVNVIQDHAVFINDNTVEGGGLRVKARKFIIATGSTAAVPTIDGINDVPYLTNETIFDLRALPEHLIIIGGGPIGCEMAQAFKNLGSQVSIISNSPIFPHDDHEAGDIMREVFKEQGITLFEQSKIDVIKKSKTEIEISIKTEDGTEKIISGSHLLIATGRKPTIDNLGLDKANVAYTKQGITVNDNLRTSNKNVYAAGDCVGHHQFTHIAEYHTGIIIQKVLFKSPFAKVDYKALPWVTYTTPEVANVGMNERQAKEKLKASDYKVLRFDYANNDRARAERSTTGFIKVIATPKGKVLGVTIIGKNAGELILPWSLAITKKLKLSDITGQIVPYPTYNEVSKRVAGSFYKEKLFSDLTKKIVGFLKHF